MRKVGDRLAARAGASRGPTGGTTLSVPTARGRADGLLPRAFALAVMVAVLGAYAALAIVGVVFATGSLAQAVLSALIVAALLALQLGVLSRPDRRPGPLWSWVALAVQAVLVFAPIALFGPVWHGFPGFLAGSALLVLGPARGGPAFVLVIATIAVVSAADAPVTAQAGSIIAVVYVITSATTSGLAVYGLSTLVRLTFQAHEAREDLRRAAAAQERARLARDVHGLLGQTLSVIALRGQLIARLVGRDTQRARAELAGVLELSRAALADVRRVVGLRRDLEQDDADLLVAPPSTGAIRLGRMLLVGVVVALSVNVVVGAYQERGAAAALVLAGLRLALLVLLLAVTRTSGRSPLRRRLALLGTMAVIAYGAPVVVGEWGGGGDSILAGAALLALGPLAGGAVAVATVVAGLVAELLSPSPGLPALYAAAYQFVGSVLVTLLVYGLGTLPRLVRRIDEAREELAELAVERERGRVARDVHDLLGLGLSMIAVKCELADKLLERAPERARDELADVLVAAQQALVEVRSAVVGERELSLDDEWRSVEATLAAATVEVRMSRLGEAPPGRPGSVLATVLREGATNVLRHSSARWCEISLRRTATEVTLEIVNDGLRSRPAGTDGEYGGSGLRNMAERVSAVGGNLNAGPDGQVFRLLARLPTAA